VLDFAGDTAHWEPPARGARTDLLQARLEDTAFAPENTLERSFSFLGRHVADLPGGSFVFVFSDFLSPPPVTAWLEAGARGWDIVPVVIQDTVWDRGFPEVDGAVLPIADPATGAVSLVRLSRRETTARRAEHVARAERLRAELGSFGLQAVRLSTTDPHEIDRAFVEWAEERRRGGRAR
jgi:hypothetical protein